MKRFEKSPYDFRQMQKLQQKLDESDPFLVESLSAKNNQELLDYAQNFERHYEMAMQSRNDNTRRNAVEVRSTIMALLELRRLTDLLDRVENQSEDGLGGGTLT